MRRTKTDVNQFAIRNDAPTPVRSKRSYAAGFTQLLITNYLVEYTPFILLFIPHVVKRQPVRLQAYNQCPMPHSQCPPHHL
ncbi:MAG: hypothetical protein ACRAVC_01055 [Trichormus sp.]